MTGAGGLPFREFLASLEQTGKGSERAFLEGDPTRELNYLRSGAYRFERVLGLLGDVGGASILDVGPTPFTLYLRRRFPDARVHAVDKTDHLGQRFERHGVVFRTCDLGGEDSLPFDDATMDVIIFTEVLEHLFRPPTEILTDMRRVLRPGGRLIISVPNIASLKKRIAMVLGRSPLQDPDEVMKRGWMHGYGHVHEYTRSELHMVLRRAGFRIDRTCGINFRAGDAMRQHGISFPKRLAKAAYCMLATTLPDCSGAIMVRAIVDKEHS